MLITNLVSSHKDSFQFFSCSDVAFDTVPLFWLPVNDVRHCLLTISVYVGFVFVVQVHCLPVAFLHCLQLRVLFCQLTLVYHVQPAQMMKVGSDNSVVDDLFLVCCLSYYSFVYD